MCLESSHWDNKEDEQLSDLTVYDMKYGRNSSFPFEHFVHFCLINTGKQRDWHLGDNDNISCFLSNGNKWATFFFCLWLCYQKPWGSCFTFNCQCCFPSMKTAILIQPQISKDWPWQPPVVLLSVTPHGLDCISKLASWLTLAHLQEGLMSMNLIIHIPYIWTTLGWIAMNWMYHTDFGSSPVETLYVTVLWNDTFLSSLRYLCVKW